METSTAAMALLLGTNTAVTTASTHARCSSERAMQRWQPGWLATETQRESHCFGGRLGSLCHCFSGTNECACTFMGFRIGARNCSLQRSIAGLWLHLAANPVSHSTECLFVHVETQLHPPPLCVSRYTSPCIPVSSSPSLQLICDNAPAVFQPHWLVGGACVTMCAWQYEASVR